MIAMTVMSRLAGRLAKLPPAETYDVIVERDLKAPMPDGVVLLAAGRHHVVPTGCQRLWSAPGQDGRPPKEVDVVSTTGPRITSQHRPATTSTSPASATHAPSRS